MKIGEILVARQRQDSSEASAASFHVSPVAVIQQGCVDCDCAGEPPVDPKRVLEEARTRAPTMCGPSDLWPDSDDDDDDDAACSAQGPPRARSPETPRARTAWTTPPCTPRGPARPVPATPPLRRPSPAEPLLLGLQRHSLKHVRLAIEESPEAAKGPLWEPRFEWPLCAAIRLGCSEEIVRLLIENGAKVHVTSAGGQSPLQLLSAGTERTRQVFMDPFTTTVGVPGIDEWTERMRQSVVQLELGVATALLDSGADPGAIHGDPGKGHCSSLELARRSGKDHLVGLYEAHRHQQRV